MLILNLWNPKHFKPGSSHSKPVNNPPKPGSSNSKPVNNPSKPGSSHSKPANDPPKPGSSHSKPLSSDTKPELLCSIIYFEHKNQNNINTFKTPCPSYHP